MRPDGYRFASVDAYTLAPTDRETGVLTVNAVRSRLTYANVMSTLALFIALGGGAYAVNGSEREEPGAQTAQIPTRGGTIIGCYNRRSGDLRVVRSSRRCRRGRERVLRWQQRQRPVDLSGFYTKTETEQRFLPLNGTAQNAALLEGLRAASFEGSEAIVKGRANQTSGTRDALVSIPSMGFAVLTDGDGDADGQLRVQNTKQSGSISVLSGNPVTPDHVVAPGTTSPEAEPGRFDDADTDYWERLIVDDASGATALVRCYWNGNEGNCFALAG